MSKAGKVILGVVGAVVVLSVIGSNSNKNAETKFSSVGSNIAPATASASGGGGNSINTADTEGAHAGEWAAWYKDKGDEFNTLVNLMQSTGESATAGDASGARAGCAALSVQADDVTAGLPDTPGGNEFRTAVSLVKAGATSCLAGDYETAGAKFVAAGDAFDRATALVSAALN